MSKHTLDNLFNSRVRVKLLRLFFRSPDKDFSVAEIARKIREPYYTAKKEIFQLRDMGLIKKR